MKPENQYVPCPTGKHHLDPQDDLCQPESGVSATPQKAGCACGDDIDEEGENGKCWVCKNQPEKPSDLLDKWESMWPFNEDTVLINSVKKLLQTQATKSYEEGRADQNEENKKIGLKDKNGNWVREGDYLKRTQKNYGNFVDEIYTYFEVIWNNQIAGFEYKPIKKSPTSFLPLGSTRPFGGEEIEIINHF